MIEFNEISTLVSDAVLGVAALTMSRGMRNSNWRIFFIFMGVSALLGAIGHGFLFTLSTSFRILAWNFLAVAIFFGEMAAFDHLGKSTKWIVYTLMGKVILVIGLSWVYRSFTISIINAGIGFLGIVLGIYAYTYSKSRDKSKWIIAGALSIIFPALVFWLDVNAIPKYLNANDLGHYLTIIPLYFIYRGARFPNVLNDR
ncbi:MAG TPA: hypothetical protein DDX92_13565 [Flavobacteriales bacterium]|nr:hypothetical protein [Flavobacteriales bacterium]